MSVDIVSTRNWRPTILTSKGCGVGFDKQRWLFRDICCKSPLGAKIGYELTRCGVFSEIPFWRFLANRQTMFDFVHSISCQRTPHRPPIYTKFTPTPYGHTSPTATPRPPKEPPAAVQPHDRLEPSHFPCARHRPTQGSLIPATPAGSGKMSASVT